MADSTGRVVGGHLVGDDAVHTTCEVVLGVARGGVVFAREHDAATGYEELSVTSAAMRGGGSDAALAEDEGERRRQHR